MLWIELAGPPGVGKSTTFKCIRGRTERNKAATGEIPAEWLPWFEFVRSVYQPVNAAKYGLFVKRARIAAACNGDILDDTLVQRGQSMYSAGVGFGDVIRYYETMPLPLGVVMLDNHLDEIKSRNRKRSRDLSHQAEDAMRVFEAAHEILAARDCKILHLSTDRAPKNNAIEITQWARSL